MILWGNWDSWPHLCSLEEGRRIWGYIYIYFFPFLALHHTSWMCVKAGRYTALWWTECEKWARKNAQSDGRITKQKMFLCWYSKSLTTSTCKTTSSDEKMIYYFTEKRQLSPVNSKENIKRERFLKNCCSFLFKSKSVTLACLPKKKNYVQWFLIWDTWRWWLVRLQQELWQANLYGLNLSKKTTKNSI